MCRRLLTAALVLAASIAAAAELAPSGDAPGVTVVDGRAAPALRGLATSSLRMFARVSGRLQAIPFQVDERDARERWVVDLGPHPNSDESPGVVDENDALVFMNRDLGARATAAALPRGGRSWIEIRVGAADAPLGWAYAASFDANTPLATRTYQRYEPEHDRVFAERYALAFDGPLPSHVGFVDALGGTGENQIDAVRAQGEARILGGMITLSRTERDVRSEVQAWRRGPVRTIRRGQYWIRLPLGFKAKGKVDLIFYRDFVEGAAIVKVKIPPRLIPADGDLTAYFDFRDLSGAHLLVDGAMRDAVVDGVLSPAEKEVGEREADWAALVLPGGRSFLLAVRRAGALAKLDQRPYFRDGAGVGRDGRPSFGFELSHANRLETGQHALTVTGMILPTTDPEPLRRAASILLSPPAVEVAPIGDAR
ncbi:MAG: hypothetical protein QOD06_1493 [Candidatus Binatota bacterium]|nr:hypothetical protein [Candidatus Binatota bacterium]